MSLPIIEERCWYNGSPTFLLFTLIPFQVTNPHLLTFYFPSGHNFAVSIPKLAVSDMVICHFWYLQSHVLQHSWFSSPGAALLPLDPQKIPGVPIQVPSQSDHSSQHHLWIYWLLTLLFNPFSTSLCHTQGPAGQRHAEQGGSIALLHSFQCWLIYSLWAFSIRKVTYFNLYFIKT